MAIRDIDIDASGDLNIVNGDLATVGFDGDGIAQDIAQALRLFLGEDVVSPNEGTPWFQNILGKNPDPSVLRQTFTDVILGRPGVVSVDLINMNYVRATRTLTVDFRATGDKGELIASTVALPVSL